MASVVSILMSPLQVTGGEAKLLLLLRLLLMMLLVVLCEGVEWERGSAKAYWNEAMSVSQGKEAMKDNCWLVCEANRRQQKKEGRG